MTVDTATFNQLQHAAGIIHNALTGTGPGNPHDIVQAQLTLAQLRHHTTGPLRTALDTYLNDDTWHHGPLPLLNAIHNLADQLDIPKPATNTGRINEQLQLFNDPETPTNRHLPPARVRSRRCVPPTTPPTLR